MKCTKEKEAGFAILNSLPGAKVVDKEAQKITRDTDKICRKLAQAIQELDEWLSLDNDALFER